MVPAPVGKFFQNAAKNPKVNIAFFPRTTFHICILTSLEYAQLINMSSGKYITVSFWSYVGDDEYLKKYIFAVFMSYAENIFLEIFLCVCLKSICVLGGLNQ